MDRYVLMSVMTIWLVSSFLVMGTYAYFSDTETSTGNSMAAGVLNLNVNDEDPYPIQERLVDLELKPGYLSLSEPIGLMVNDNPGKIYKRISHLVCGADTTAHSLAENTWFSLTADGGNVIDTETVSLEDIDGKWIYLGTYDPQEQISVVQGFQLDECLFEWSETESCTFVEEFSALQTNELHPAGCFNCEGTS